MSAPQSSVCPKFEYLVDDSWVQCAGGISSNSPLEAPLSSQAVPHGGVNQPRLIIPPRRGLLLQLLRDRPLRQIRSLKPRTPRNHLGTPRKRSSSTRLDTMKTRGPNRSLWHPSRLPLTGPNPEIRFRLPRVNTGGSLSRNDRVNRGTLSRLPGQLTRLSDRRKTSPKAGFSQSITATSTSTA